MKKKFFIIIEILISIVLFQTCKKDILPKASFIVQGNEGTAPCNVSFENTSSDANSFEWDFGDGSTSNENSPTHKYITAGSFTVTLTAINNDKKNSTSHQVLIHPAQEFITADFNFSPNGGQFPITINFTNNSTNATSYEWDFGDGSSSTHENPSHKYNTAGIFTISLTAKNESFSPSTITKTKTINITSPSAPTANFTYSPNTGNAPCNIQFTNTSTNANEFIWDFGDGNSSTVENPNHQYTISGTFSIKLTAINSFSSVIVQKTITINPPIQPIADFTISFQNENDVAPCNVVFQNTSQASGITATTYSWNFGDGTTSTNQNAIHSYVKDGTYIVTLTVTNANGTSTKTETVTINPPIVKITKMVLVGVINPSGGYWDVPLVDSPDWYLEFLNSAETTLLTTSVQTADLPVEWSTNLLVSPNETFTVKAWDQDNGPFGGVNDSAGEVTVSFAVPDYNNFPAMITKSNNGTIIQFYIVLQ